MLKHCSNCGAALVEEITDIDQTIRGVHVRIVGVPARSCHACGEKQLSLPVARYVSEYLRRLLTDLPEPPEGFGGVLTPKEVVFSAA